jgi:hypothetical protein
MNSKQMFKQFYNPSTEYPMWKYHVDTLVDKIISIFSKKVWNESDRF